MSDVTPDLEGRRIAQRQSVIAAEAARFADCLAVLMRRAGVDAGAAVEIAKSLRIKSVDLEAKATGHIESRNRYRGSGSPLIEGRPINCLYLDESGTSVPGVSDGVFALAGLAIEEADVAEYIVRADQIKREFFGTINHTFHEPKMRNRRGDYSFRGDRGKQDRFLGEIRRLLDETQFVCFGIGIRKEAFKAEFIDSGIDPYLPTRVYDLAIMLIMERYVDYLATSANRRMGRMMLESIGAREDAEHQAAYADVLLHGTQFLSESGFQSWLETGCRFSPKTGSNPAELADLIAREVFEWTRSECKVAPPHWDIISKKLYCREDGRNRRFGLKVFPSSGIQDHVDAHRESCLT